MQQTRRVQRKHIHRSDLKILSVSPVEAWTLQLPPDNQNSTISAD